MESLRTLWNSVDWQLLGDLISRLLAVFLCLTVHETCHGLAACALGDPTAKRQHRLSFNPLRHIDWLGFASMLIVGFGWAKPVPVDMRYFKKPKQGMALTALAGPVSNFLLAMVFLVPVGWIYWHARATAFTLWLYSFLVNVVILSIGLGLFNLLPIPPLDGSKVLFALLPDRLYWKLMRYERYGMLVLLLLVVFDVGSDFLSRGILLIFSALANLIVL